MPIPPDVLGKIIEKIPEKLYEDMLSDSAKEASKIGVDLVKTTRLFLAPLQITAAFQDRLESLIKRVAARVPEDRYIEAPAELVGPAIEKMKYIDESNPLWQMFEELLSRSVDKTEVSNVHPAFVHIISQLSRDEAFILYKLREKDFEIVDTLDLNVVMNKFENRKIEKSDIPAKELFLPDKVDLYYSHLESLSLVAWPVNKQEPIVGNSGVQLGTRRYSKMHLTEFGKLFVHCLCTY